MMKPLRRVLVIQALLFARTYAKIEFVRMLTIEGGGPLIRCAWRRIELPDLIRRPVFSTVRSWSTGGQGLGKSN